MKRSACGFRFQGVHFEFSKLKNKVSPPEVWALGPVAIGVFAALQTISLKYNDRVVYPTLGTLRSRAGGRSGLGKAKPPRLTERQVKDALRRLKAAGFIADGASACRGRAQERELLVELELFSGKLVFRPIERTGALPGALRGLVAWGGARPNGVPLALQDGPHSAEQVGPHSGGKTDPIQVQVGPHSGASGTPFEKEGGGAANHVEQIEELVASGTPIPFQVGPPVVKEKIIGEETSGEDLLFLTEKRVAAADAAAGSFSSSPPNPSRVAPILTLVPNPPLKAAQPPVPPAVQQVGAAAPIDLDALDPDDTPGFSPGRPSLWKGKPQVGPMPADFAAHYGKLAHLYWGKPQTAGPLRYGINGLPTRPPTGCVMYTTPGPPRVPGYGDDDEARERKLKFVLKWYRVALMSRGIDPPRNVGLKGQSRKYFEDALDIFEAHDIAPGAWVAWALDRILVKMPPNARKRFTPQTKVLLSPKSLVENRWQYREMEADYTTPHIKHSPEGKKLYDRFLVMERDVLASLDRSERAITAIVDRHFPEGYRAALKKSQENSMRCEQEVLAQIQRGNWLWPLPRELQPKKKAMRVG